MKKLIKKLGVFLNNGIKRFFSLFLAGGEDMRKQLRKSFFTGLLVVIPIGATIYILIFLIEILNDLLPFSFLPYGTGIVFTIILITLVGFMTTNFIGKRLIEGGEQVISRIPLVKNVYAAVKQISDAMLSSPGKKYRRVVLIEYPRKGIYTLAFVTGIAKGEIQNKTTSNVINLFVPTTPNPTSGFYLMVPENDVIDLDISVEDAFKLLISGGMVSAENNRSEDFF
ncbi:MAG: DUF502 domain-containing protein [Thermodesulfobacteriota bacterium]|nr:DUF502 domain-containing protein [Thermodesulfobacteriota bacterium]